MRRLLSFLAILAATTLVAPAFASANLASEVARGHHMVDAVRSGQRQCSSLSADDFESIGEYAMGRFLGSTAAHAVMNRRMALMIGTNGERRMHIALGYRYSGCPGGRGSAWMGPMAAMMSGYHRGAGQPRAYGSGMMGGYRYRGSGYGGSMMGRRFGSGGDSDLGPWGVAAIALAAAAVGGLVAGVLLRARKARPGATG
jgi:hypothetical protein